MRRSGNTGGTTSNQTSSSRRDAPTTDDAPTPGPDQGGGSSAPAPAPTTTPAPAPTTTTPTPAPAPAGACGNPKCVAFLGTAGCKATDTSGAAVVLGCDQGACACLTGGQQTSTFAANPATIDDAKALFIANCDCL